MQPPPGPPPPQRPPPFGQSPIMSGVPSPNRPGMSSAVGSPVMTGQMAPRPGMTGNMAPRPAMPPGSQTPPVQRPFPQDLGLGRPGPPPGAIPPSSPFMGRSAQPSPFGGAPNLGSPGPNAPLAGTAAATLASPLPVAPLTGPQPPQGPPIGLARPGAPSSYIRPAMPPNQSDSNRPVPPPAAVQPVVPQILQSPASQPPSMQTVTASMQQVGISRSKRVYPGSVPGGDFTSPSMTPSGSQDRIASMPAPNGMFPPNPGMTPMPPQPSMNAPQSMPLQPGMAPPHPGMIPSQTMPPQPGMIPSQSGMMAPQQPLSPRDMSGRSGRIDPDQMPSPINVQILDEQVYREQPYVSSSRQPPPLATTDFLGIDEYSCNPRFMRLTTSTIPTTEEIANATGIPLGLIIQPLAQLRSDERPIPVVMGTENGPIRCARCLAYMNPMMRFIDGGQRFVCNMCDHVNPVAPEFFCNLDTNGRRIDLEQRPEMVYGSVEYVAPKDFQTRPLGPLRIVFAIDVSWLAQQNGLIMTFSQTMRRVLEQLPEGTRVSIVAFDRVLYFFNISANLDQPQMIVVSDVEDSFVPLTGDSFLVDPRASKSVIEALLDALPKMFTGHIGESAFGAAAQACIQALQPQGGRLIMFQCALPSHGPGTLKIRDESKGTDNDKELFAAQNEFYTLLADKCVSSAVSVDLFTFPNGYMDLATTGVLASVTGGETRMYRGFNVERDGMQFGSDLQALLSRDYGMDGLLRVRCSNGLKITEHHGNFFMKNATDVELAGIDSAKAIGVVFRHEAKLDEKADVCFQVALLYTNARGERRIRVHNLAVSCSSQHSVIFRGADIDACVSLMTKNAISQTASMSLRSVRDFLGERCVRVLTGYRKTCTSTSLSGQLILPESLKLYPIYTMSLLKNKAFKPGADVTVDMRVAAMRTLKCASLLSTVITLYPRLLPLHSQGPAFAPGGQPLLPAPIRLSYERLQTNGVYLLENGTVMYIWVGRDVPSELLMSLFGVPSREQIDPRVQVLPETKDPLNSYIHAVLKFIFAQRKRFIPARLVRQQMDPAEQEFAFMLIEDKNNDGLSYVDHICQVHRQIQTEMST